MRFWKKFQTDSLVICPSYYILTKQPNILFVPFKLLYFCLDLRLLITQDYPKLIGSSLGQIKA